MKKVRIINKKESDSKPVDGIGETAPVINKEIIKAKPVKFTDKGITAFQRDTKPTEEGLETEQQKPVLFDGRGRHINSESDLQGECHVCHKFVSLIFYCSVQGCKILLCEEHVFIFNDGASDFHCCEQHYNDFIMNYDTWHPRQKKVNNEKPIRKDK